MSGEIKALLAQAPLSFVGTVERLTAATMEHVKIDERTAVVHVDRVLHAPDELTRLAGQKVTVQLSPKVDPPAIGETLAFFVQGLVFGKSIAVTEVGRLPASAVAPHVQTAMRAGKTAGAFDDLLDEMKRDGLRTRMRQADVVVIGIVVGVEKVGPVAWSEHDPDWWRATINIDHVERGTVGGGSVMVLFANSHDVRWHHCPKPQAGQSGVWVLHRTETALADLAPFQILDPDDVQPIQQLDVLRAPGV